MRKSRIGVYRQENDPAYNGMCPKCNRTYTYIRNGRCPSCRCRFRSQSQQVKVFFDILREIDSDKN